MWILRIADAAGVAGPATENGASLAEVHRLRPDVDLVVPPAAVEIAVETRDQPAGGSLELPFAAS